MPLPILKKWLFLQNLKYWFKTKKGFKIKRFHLSFTFVLQYIFITQSAITLCLHSQKIQVLLTNNEKCSFSWAHNFKLDGVKTFLEGEGRKWLCIKQLLCAFFFCVLDVLYVNSFQCRYNILILPLRKLRLSNWPMVTLLEIAEPESNPGLSNSKAWALVQVGTGDRTMHQMEGASGIA